MIGQVVNNYEIQSLLGQGGMGSVYVARHKVIDRQVAIKVMKREFAEDRELVRRFFDEARAAAAIHNPHIIDVIDVGVLPDGLPYLMMELLAGKTLAARLAEAGRLPLTEALE